MWAFMCLMIYLSETFKMCLNPRPRHETDAQFWPYFYTKYDSLPSHQDLPFDCFRYVFFLLEHPYHQWNDLRNFQSIFNLTMTYRRDSDVPLLYGKVVPRDPGEPWQPKNLAKSRKLVAWFVGNCDTKSKRELYVKELQKYIDVDIYGKCGPLKCPDNPKVL